jgi:hypothetical protein
LTISARLWLWIGLEAEIDNKIRNVFWMVYAGFHELLFVCNGSAAANSLCPALLPQLGSAS